MSALFTRKAPPIMQKLMADFPAWGELDAAAVLGNIGGETGGFKLMQEVKPLVKGSRGGWGWCQWTGPRRRAFEAWCKEQRLSVESDAANYGFLRHELKTSERKAIAAVAAAGTLEAKTIAFERSFERAGIPHHESRIRWARLALKAYLDYGKKPVPKPAPEPAPQPDDPGPEISPEPDIAPVPVKQGWFRSFGSKVKATLVSAGFGGLAYLTDWQIALAFFGFLLILIIIAIAVFFWIFDAEDVRAWIRKQVS